MQQDTREFVYRINAQDRIVQANEHWYAFANENGLATVNPTTLIGESLWKFITGREVRHLYTLLIKRVRDKGIIVVFPYRCDSPERRRFMELEIHARAGREIEFVSRILREETRDPVRLLELKVPRNTSILMMCSWCKKVRVRENCWFEVEEAIQLLNLFQHPQMPRISHGICQPCSVSFFNPSWGGIN